MSSLAKGSKDSSPEVYMRMHKCKLEVEVEEHALMSRDVAPTRAESHTDAAQCYEVQPYSDSTLL